MKTPIEKVFQIDQPIDKVWHFLADPNQVITCVPGATISEVLDEHNFKGKVRLKFGPINIEYDGEIQILKLDEADKEIVLRGQGLDAGGQGSIDMLMNGKLSEVAGGTEVYYAMQVSPKGLLAQFGAGLVDDVTDQVIHQFVQNFKAKLSGEKPVEDHGDSSINAVSLMGSLVKNKLGNLFGRKKNDAAN
ncbi:MAG: SRPBCC family protein [Bacteroidota bacterium]